MTELSPTEQVLKDEFVRARGYWRPWTEALLKLNPAFLSLYANYAGHAAEYGPLSRRMCELIYVALDGSATHLFRSGLKLHMELALESGATAQEIVEVLQLATAQGLDGCFIGTSILAEELVAAGEDVAFLAAPLTDEQQRLRTVYEGRFGDWPAACEHLVRLDPRYFEQVLQLLADARPDGGLSDKERTLIALALNACFTALNPDGVRLNIRRALRLGATREEILQVLQMTAHLGVHACAVGLPCLTELMSVAKPADAQ
jgi:alkylhydroperoxidase/carboxymuconolactone decarboxylase family protein YurZ